MPPMYTLALGEENPYYSKRCRGIDDKRVYKYIYRYTYKLDIYPHFPLSSEILSKCFPLTYIYSTQCILNNINKVKIYSETLL